MYLEVVSMLNINQKVCPNINIYCNMINLFKKIVQILKKSIFFIVDRVIQNKNGRGNQPQPSAKG